MLFAAHHALKAFSGEEDITAQAKAAAEAQQAMTSGEVLGSDGEEVKSIWDRILGVLGGIEENTGETVETIEQTSAAAQEMEERRRNQETYVRRMRSDMEALLNNRAQSLAATIPSVDSVTAGLP